MSEPWTDAGRDLLVHYSDGAIGPEADWLVDRILAIEAEARSTPAEALEPNVLQHAWIVLTAFTNPNRWDPDRYNCAAFLEAWMAEYARLCSPERDRGGGRFRPCTSCGRVPSAHNPHPLNDGYAGHEYR